MMMTCDSGAGPTSKVGRSGTVVVKFQTTSTPDESFRCNSRYRMRLGSIRTGGLLRDAVGSLNGVCLRVRRQTLKSMISLAGARLDEFAAYKQ